MASQPYSHDSDKASTNFAPQTGQTNPSNTVITEILQLLHDRKNGTYKGDDSWFKRTLKPSEYDELRQLIRYDESLWVYAKTKLRHDYNPITHTLVIRMPTGIHEVFIENISNELSRRLNDIASNSNEPDVISLAKSIRQLRSTTITLQAEDKVSTIRCDPDNQLRPRGTKYPTAVLEISYAQKRKDVSALADDYIVLSRGRIQVVVGIDIEYGKENVGTLSVWRAQFSTMQGGERVIRTVQPVINQIFRDADGKPNLSPDAGLRLYLSDFAPPDLNHGSDLINGSNASFLIDSASLCQFLRDAEEEWRMVNQEDGQLTEEEGNMVLERRSETLPEELDPEDEEAFLEKERKALERAEEDDGEYRIYKGSKRT